MLLWDAIQTFEQLEAFLLLRRDSSHDYTAADVAERLGISESAAAAVLDHLRRSSLIEARGGAPERFRYSPLNEHLGDETGSFAIGCEASSIEVIRLMSRKAVERLRTSAIEAFRDASLLRGQKPSYDTE